MRPTYQRIAYDGMDVANPISLAAILTMVDRVRLPRDAAALDIGAGSGAISVALARRAGLVVHAVERDAGLAERIRARVSAAGVGDRVRIHVQHAAVVLPSLPPFDLIVALGTTEPAGPAVRAGPDLFRALAAHLNAPGYLLWGDLFWKGDPPAPLRQVIGMSGDYATDDGWRAAAAAAGLTCIAADSGSPSDWDAYFGGADLRVRAWLDAHPDTPEASAIRTRADQIRATFEFGRPWLGFGLYLFGKGTAAEAA